MADRLEFVGRAVEENSFFRNLPKMSLRRGEQFGKLGSSLFDSLKGHPESGIATRKLTTTEHARSLRDGRRAGEKRSRSSLSARLEQRKGSAREARLSKAR